jgi:urocanate hydratase
VIEDATANRPIRAARGTAVSCKGWEQETSLRMLMNSLDAEIAERPEQLIVETGRARMARDWKSFHAIVASLETLENDETLLVQSGQPAEILRTRPSASRVVIADAHSPSWVFTGAQQYLPSAYEALAAAAQGYFQGSLGGKLVLRDGMTGRGAALPLAATLNGAAFLGFEADVQCIKARVKAGYCDVMVNNLDEALRILKNAVRKRQPSSVGLQGNSAEIIPELARRGVVPDLLLGEGGGFSPAEVRTPLADGLRALAEMGALKPDLDWDPDETRVPMILVALSGEPADIGRADELLVKMFPRDEALCRWIALARKHVRFEGLTARACLLDASEHSAFGFALNDLAARGELKAPIAIGHADAGEARGALDAVAGGA